MKCENCELNGRFKSKVRTCRRVRLPEEWYAALGGPKEVVLVPNAEGEVDLIPVETFAAECEVLRRKSTADPAVQRALEILERKAERVEVGPRCLRIGDHVRDDRAIAGAEQDRVGLWGRDCCRSVFDIISPDEGGDVE